ncbi:MAG: FkbM family methyltransferase [Opitutaceae bacterium]
MLIRKILFKILPHRCYLRLVSFIFIKTYLLKVYLPEHVYVLFLRRLIPDEGVTIDIGANLGYFTVMMSRCCGERGKVYAVEPVALFREILNGNVERYAGNNVEILPYALGDEDYKEISMVTATVDGITRHGQTEVVETPSVVEGSASHGATMMRPDTLFGELERLDFIKCDVEGYELHILPHLMNLLEKFKPTLEIEVDSRENKVVVIEMMASLGYQGYYLIDSQLKLFDFKEPESTTVIELYFVHESNDRVLREVVAGSDRV